MPWTHATCVPCLCSPFPAFPALPALYCVAIGDGERPIARITKSYSI
jgi:hypothetical protein